MPYRTPAKPIDAKLKQDEPWPSLPEPWWRDVVTPPGAAQVYWTLCVVAATLTLGTLAALVLESGWLKAALTCWVIGVMACSASLFGDAWESVQERRWLASFRWTAARLLVLATFYVPCTVMGAWRVAALMAGTTVILIAIPLLGAILQERLTR